MTDQLVTVGEAARILAACEDSVRRWADAGVLSATRTQTGLRIFERREVEALAAARARRREQRNGRSAA